MKILSVPMALGMGCTGALWCGVTWIYNRGNLDPILSGRLLPFHDGCGWRWVGCYPWSFSGWEIDFFGQTEVAIHQPAIGGRSLSATELAMVG